VTTAARAVTVNNEASILRSRVDQSKEAILDDTQYPSHLYSAVRDKPALQLTVLHHRGVQLLGIVSVLVTVQVILPNEQHGNWNMPSKAVVVRLGQYVPVVLERTRIGRRLGGGKKVHAALPVMHNAIFKYENEKSIRISVVRY
jgi:hypothetical protein